MMCAFGHKGRTGVLRHARESDTNITNVHMGEWDVDWGLVEVHRGPTTQQQQQHDVLSVDP